MANTSLGSIVNTVSTSSVINTAGRKVQSAGGDGSIIKTCLQVINNLLDGDMKQMHGLCKLGGDLPYYILGIINNESSFNFGERIYPHGKGSSVGPNYSKGSTARNVLAYKENQKKIAEVGADEFLKYGYTVAWGPMGSMGWNHVDFKTRDCEMRVLVKRKLFVECINRLGLLVPVGTDLRTVFTSTGPLEKGIAAGMLMFSTKLLYSKGNVEAALKSYLGSGVDRNTGMSTSQYFQKIRNNLDSLKSGNFSAIGSVSRSGRRNTSTTVGGYSAGKYDPSSDSAAEFGRKQGECPTKPKEGGGKEGSVDEPGKDEATGKEYCKFDSDTGVFRYVKEDGSIIFEANAISGVGYGENNSSLEAQNSVGPIPRGRYTIGGRRDTLVGSYRFITASLGTNTFGRTLFQLKVGAVDTSVPGQIAMPRSYFDSLPKDRDIDLVVEGYRDGLEKSGPQWCDRYPGSNSVQNLKEPFRSKVTEFIAAMRRAGISVTITSGYRPPARSYLMYHSKHISDGTISCTNVPEYKGSGAPIKIDWAHITNGAPNVSAARAAASAMVKKYGTHGNDVALVSNHNDGQALDMKILNYSGKTIKNKQGLDILITTWSVLVNVGHSYGVIWRGVSDTVHWSLTGD